MLGTYSASSFPRVGGAGGLFYLQGPTEGFSSLNCSTNFDISPLIVIKNRISTLMGTRFGTRITQMENKFQCANSVFLEPERSRHSTCRLAIHSAPRVVGGQRVVTDSSHTPHPLQLTGHDRVTWSHLGRIDRRVRVSVKRPGP